MAEKHKRSQKPAELRADLVFDIDGMDCAACAVRIEKLMGRQAGVRRARVNFAVKRAYAELEPQFSADKAAAEIKAVVAKAGYKTWFAAADGVETVAENAGAAPALPKAHAHEKRAHEKREKHIHAERGSGYAERGSGHAEHGSGHTHEHGFGARAAQEEKRQMRAFWQAFTVTVPVFAAEMGSHIFMLFGGGFHAGGFLHNSAVLWAELILTGLALLIPGRVFFVKGIPPLLHGYPNMNSLVAVGAFAAWGYSAFSVIYGAATGTSVGAVYFESAGVIVTLILLGRVLEARSRAQAGAAIAALAALAPKTAKIRRAGKVEEVALSAVKRGDEVIIRPGEKLPADGTVLEGASALNEAMMTGEPFPIAKKQGDKVFAGTVNGAGTLTYRAESIGNKTVLAQIQRMVEQAQAAKLPIAALADKITAWFVPAVFAAAMLSFIAWLALAPGHDIGAALIKAVSVLIIACPCAMGLAAPMAVIVGTGRAASLGVLFRRGDALQRLCETEIAAFDKTGTLTAGKPSLAFFVAAPGRKKADIADIKAKIAAAEAYSEHPIAAAFSGAAALPALKAEQFSAALGKGVSAVVGGETVAVGSAAFMAELGVDISPLKAEAEARSAQGLSPVFAAVGGFAAALFAVQDSIRAQAPQAIAALKAYGLHIAVITGDSAAAAQKLAQKLGIDDVRARVKPGDKAKIVREFQQKGRSVAFIGDGINDAPALSQADVGLAIGTGADAALEAADIVLMTGEPAAVVRAYGISRATLRNIKQNLFWAFAYNALLIPIAAGVLEPFGGFGLSPVLAAAAMALSSLFVAGNALRLRRFAA